MNCQLQEQANNLDCSPHFSFFFFFFLVQFVSSFFAIDLWSLQVGIIYTITLASPKPEGAKEVKD